MLEDVSARSGAGAASTAHGEAEVERTAAAYSAAFARLREGGIL
jgi:hypothetical protein